MNRKGFTLAEVLITLTIIGVIAAITIPNVISNYKKSVVVSRLQKAAAQISHAYKLGVINSGTPPGFTPNNPNAALEMFNIYYEPYINFEKIEKGKYGVFGYLKDGSAFYFRKEQAPESWSWTYVFICITHQACKNIKENNATSADKIQNGKDVFGWYTNGNVPTSVFKNISHETRIYACKNNTSREACSGLIYEAGWKIPKDYPIKI